VSAFGRIIEAGEEPGWERDRREGKGPDAVRGVINPGEAKKDRRFTDNDGWTE
jgi:hypothetical protein